MKARCLTRSKETRLLMSDAQKAWHQRRRQQASGQPSDVNPRVR
jgi:hypothetical protein